MRKREIRLLQVFLAGVIAGICIIGTVFNIQYYDKTCVNTYLFDSYSDLLGNCVMLAKYNKVILQHANFDNETWEKIFNETQNLQ